MSFYSGSLYIIVNTQRQWFLFVAGRPHETNNTITTSPIGTLYYPGNDLKSRQELNFRPFSRLPAPVLFVNVDNLISTFGTVISADNYINRIVIAGDQGPRPSSVDRWWFDLLHRLHSHGVINYDPVALSQNTRTQAETALASYYRTGVYTVR